MTNYSIIKEETISSPNNKKHTLIDATVQLPNGNQVIWQYLKTRDVVSIAALEENKSIWIVRQWRPARNDFVWELPAGGVEDQSATDAQIIENAVRELQEEVGRTAGKAEIVARCSPTIHTVSTYYAVVATQLNAVPTLNDPMENLEIKCVPFDEAWDLLTHTQKPSAITLINLLKAKEYLNKKLQTQ